MLEREKKNHSVLEEKERELSKKVNEGNMIVHTKSNILALHANNPDSIPSTLQIFLKTLEA